MNEIVDDYRRYKALQGHLTHDLPPPPDDEDADDRGPAGGWFVPVFLLSVAGLTVTLAAFIL